MKRALLLSEACFFLFLSLSLLLGYTPDIQPGIKIKDGSGDLKVPYHSAPNVVDWNNDGAKDLLVGQEPGYIYLYLNKGTDLNPLYQGWTKVESSGTPIACTWT